MVSFGREANTTINPTEATAAPATFGRLLGEELDLRNVEEGK